MLLLYLSSSNSNQTININSILPAIITGCVAVIGFLMNFLISFYVQRKNSSVNKFNSLNNFLIPLQKYLFILQAQYSLMKLSAEDIVLATTNISDNTLSNNCRSQIIETYTQINTLLSSGKYCYIDAFTHKSVLMLRSHVYYVIYIFNSSCLAIETVIEGLQRNPMPDIDKLLHHIDELHKKI